MNKNATECLTVPSRRLPGVCRSVKYQHMSLDGMDAALHFEKFGAARPQLLGDELWSKKKKRMKNYPSHFLLSTPLKVNLLCGKIVFDSFVTTQCCVACHLPTEVK